MVAPLPNDASMLQFTYNDQVYDLTQLDRDALLLLRLQVEQTCSAIRSQLERARATAHATGAYANQGWYRKASNALRYHGAMCQRIQTVLGQKRRAGQAPPRRPLAEYFVDVAREGLPETVFATLLETAMQRRTAEEAAV